MEDMLGEQASAISEVSEKLVQMEGLIYDLRTGWPVIFWSSNKIHVFLNQPIKRRDLGLVTDQVDGITETLEGQVQGNAEEADAERKAIMEDLENKFINMESDLKRLLNSVLVQNCYFWCNPNFREIDRRAIREIDFSDNQFISRFWAIKR